MFFFNLSLTEFLAIWGVVSGAVVALYLLDRSRRHIKVATLRFWKPSEKPPEAKHKKRIQQPWSLILQILGLTLLLAGIAQLRWGSPERGAKDHVLILDTSAWMSAREGGRAAIDQAKIESIRWLRTLPGTDRVMVVLADSLPAPATVFEANRAVTEKAILSARAGEGSLNLAGALEYARRAQRQKGEGVGEIVFAGLARGHSDDLPQEAGLPKNLRYLPVRAPARNVGIRQLSMRRAPQDAQLWEIFVAVRNYGNAPESTGMLVTFGNAPIGSGRLTINGGEEKTARYEFRTKSAGWVDARLQIRDALAADNEATLELPEQRQVKVMAYTREPGLLRTLLEANPRVAAAYAPPESFNADVDADVVVLDRFAPPNAPARNSIYIEPPRDGSPVALSGGQGVAKLSRWRTEHPIARGLRTLDLKLDQATVFQAGVGEAVAETNGGSLVTAMPGTPRRVLLGFHPGRPALRYELAMPLLMANVLEWMAPESFRNLEFSGERVGTVRVNMDMAVDAAAVQVIDDRQQAVPFSLNGRLLQFYQANRGKVRVRHEGRESVYSLTLPDLGEVAWDAPRTVVRGQGRGRQESSPIQELWPWLAMLGMGILLLEWFLFGRIRMQGALSAGFDRWVEPLRGVWKKAS